MAKFSPGNKPWGPRSCRPDGGKIGDRQLMEDWKPRLTLYSRTEWAIESRLSVPIPEGPAITLIAIRP